MREIHEKLEKLYEKNKDFNWDQEIKHGQVPSKILMIDQKTLRDVSPQMRSLYEFAISWKEGLFGLDLIDPNKINYFYSIENVKEAIELTGENYKPIPPSDPSDWNRTALMAVEDGGAGLALCLYWWAREDEIEPCVIFISGGTVNIFADVEEFIDYLADGTFPEEGDKILSNLEIERGTLSD